MALENAVILLRIEYAARGRLDAQHGEVVARDHLGFDTLGLIFDGDGGGYKASAKDLGERLGPLLEILIHGIGVHAIAHIAAVVGAALEEHHQLIGVLHRQQTQHDLVHEREDGGVGADS